jgi:hypothetical protein
MDRDASGRGPGACHCHKSGAENGRDTTHGAFLRLRGRARSNLA